MDNWKENAKKTVWTHKSSPFVQVRIEPVRPFRRGHYFVTHYHPGPRGVSILQPYEFVNSMAEARKKVRMHLKHWNDPKKWQSDPDFGKVGRPG